MYFQLPKEELKKPRLSPIMRVIRETASLIIFSEVIFTGCTLPVTAGAMLKQFEYLKKHIS